MIFDMCKDYHDYVFENGELVGDFEGMYANSSAIPWHQDLEAESWIGDIAVNMLKPFAPYNKGLEVGCGLGYFANRIAPFCNSFFAGDVSPTAISKASEIFDHISFCTGSVSNGILSV
jgi:SAM-dependent methyltransferase